MASHDASSQAIADVDLVLRARSGDTEAFGELWRRHHASGVAVAGLVAPSIDSDAIVQEAYSRIHRAIRKGAGPNGSFRAYLFTSIRNTAAAWRRDRGEAPVDEIEPVSDSPSAPPSADGALDRGLIAQAFRSLPSRWQEVLWYAEIDLMKPSEIAPLLGMSTDEVSQLVVRARTGLHAGWFEAHLRGNGQGSDCHLTIEDLGAQARGDLRAGQRRVDDHLESCARCLALATEAQLIADNLALALLPLVLGPGPAAAYLALVRSGPVPSGPVPSTPVPPAGPVIMAGHSVGGAVVAYDEAGLLSGAASAAAPDSSRGSVLGLGALVGAGSVALVVAGVVAAAAVMPTLSSSAPSTSLPNAADPASSSIASEVAPDESMTTDEPMVILVDDRQPRPAPWTRVTPVPQTPRAPRPATPPPVAVPERTGPSSASTSPPSSAPEPIVTPAPPARPSPTPTPAPERDEEAAPGHEKTPGHENTPGHEEAPGDESGNSGEAVSPDPTAPAGHDPFPESAE